MAHPPQPWRIGVDTGGTFTDLVLVGPDGTIRATHKRLSTPADPGQAVLAGVAELISKHLADHVPQAQPSVVHGSTVATNALLEGKGARAALVTTAGFEDVLAIARQNRPGLYTIVPSRPVPIITREETVSLDERVLWDGSVQTPLTPAHLDAAVEQLRGLDPESVVVCLLHSYANPAHEQAAARAIREALPGVHLTVSHELLPEPREYERAATCVANAVVGPVMSRYLGGLARALPSGRLRIMGSGGGTLPVEVVCDRPIETAVSGPAGGAIGAWAMAQAAGIDRAIGFDMGGTSTDVTLIDGRPTRTTQTVIAGLPLRLPMIDIHTVGAGGGSVARIDVGGALCVGPESAGAAPGPACYGRQSADALCPTVTDAHAVLGHLTDNRRLGDTLTIRRDAAMEAVGHLAEKASLSTEAAAHGILRVADAAMARAVKAISVQRGHDLRGYTLLAFGGAGGLHACRLAQLLGMSRVLIPRHGGLLSALGMLAAPPRHQFSRGVMAAISADPAGRYPDPLHEPRVAQACRSLTAQAHQALQQDGVARDDRKLTLHLDLRYAGQSHELTVPCGEGDDETTQAFARQHSRLYGYAMPGRPIEIVAARVEAEGPTPTINTGGCVAAATDPQEAQRPVDVTDEQGVSPWRCTQRDELRPGQTAPGPLLIEEYAATTVVPRGWNMEVLADGQLSLTR